MIVSRHGYRVLWPFACTVIHSGAIKSDVTQTLTGERGVHVHLSLPLSVSVSPPLSFYRSLCFIFFLVFLFLHAALCKCVCDRVKTWCPQEELTVQLVRNFSMFAKLATSIRYPKIKAGIISISLRSAKILDFGHEHYSKIENLKKDILNFYRRYATLKWFF